MGSYFTTDETKPRPTGSFLARAYLSWCGSLNVFWQIVIAVVVMEMLNDDIVTQPKLLPGLYITTVILSGFCFLFNMMYWGATAADRKMLTSVDGRPSLEGNVPYAKRMDRIARACGDQWVTGWILGATFFVMIWLTKFYWNRGVHVFQPLPDAATSRMIMNYMEIKRFQMATLAISAVTFAIAIYTGSDYYRRSVEETYGLTGPLMANGGGSNSASVEESGEVSTLTGVVYLNNYNKQQ